MAELRSRGIANFPKTLPIMVRLALTLSDFTKELDTLSDEEIISDVTRRNNSNSGEGNDEPSDRSPPTNSQICCHRDFTKINFISRRYSALLMRFQVNCFSRTIWPS